ncbi:hypothetical protein [Candidatus Nitrosocosmicus franklandus]|uniref:Uncharacterized protein n=1 Tax=Candidatus Nitrosocosmicus franklandianus TaxID=1798806 RepID=A0A484I7U3_9ARCH|nr:hypothetical protein [Candidatus Nitrosocosmicus franklandus]VFJ13166.1 protein of unknown function [Candidatus Nitrosocosmicus franklandus]
MCISSNDSQSHRLIENILRSDYELSLRITRKNTPVREIYESFRRRLEVYDQALLLPFNDGDKALLTFKKAEVCMDLRMYKFRQDLLRDINEMAERIENLEHEVLRKRSQISH